MGKPPNILMIVADQQRYDCIGYAGGRTVQTPHLDCLASQGVWFENAYCHIPICSPARQSLMNGRRPESFGGHWNFDLGPRVSALSPSDYAWPRDLQGLGYQSSFIGKWHVSPNADPTAFGFDEYLPLKNYERFRAERYPNVRYTAGFAGEPDPLPLEHTETHLLARWACERIQTLNQADRPWQIHLNFSGPHLPCRPAGRFADMYPCEDIAPWESFAETFKDKPYIQRQQILSWGIERYTWDDFAPIVSRYFGMICQIDDAIGQVLDKLEELGAASDTIVVYTSDHGDLCGAHRMLDKHYVLYDDVIHVPLIVRWPGKIPAGARLREFVYNLLDIPPTLLESAGVRSGGGVFHGTSLLPLFEHSASRPWRNHVISTYNGQQFGLYSQRMIRTDAWKYIWNATDVDELYDLQADPFELVNLIHEPGVDDTLRVLRETLHTHLVEQGDRLLDNEWVRRQLLHGRKL